MHAEPQQTFGDDYDAGQHIGRFYLFGKRQEQIYRVDGNYALECDDAEMDVHGPIQGIAATLFDAGGKSLRTSERNSLLWSIAERRNDPCAPEAFKPSEEK